MLQTCRKQRDCEDYTFPSSTIKQTRYTAPNIDGTIYIDEDNVPIWFKEKHNDILIPTVFTCWANPSLLPILLTHEVVIEERLFNGANLMLAGTVPPFDQRCIPGTLCGIASREMPKRVMAIGKVLLDMPSYDSVIGKTGVAVEVIHYLPDGLSTALKVKLEPPEILVEKQDNSANRENDNDLMANDSAKREANTVTNGINIDDVAEVLDELRVEDVDHFFIRSLYQTLTHDDKLQLPTGASNFISNHILPNLPVSDNNEISMKKTSWKKTAKFLKHFEKEGYLKLKGIGDDLTVVGINKEKEELKRFVPYKIPDRSAVHKAGEKGHGGVEMMYSETFYKPKNFAKNFISEVSLPPKLLYDTKELQSSMTEYLTNKNLIDTKNKKMVILDDLLFSMIKAKKSQKVESRIVSRAEIMEPFLENNFQPFYQLYKDENTPLFRSPLKGPLSHVHIATEMKMGRKVVTKISNFEFFLVDPEVLATDLKKACNGSTTIGETTNSPKTSEVQVQGSHVKIVTEYLNKKGIPSKWIDVSDKVKKAKKRKN